MKNKKRRRKRLFWTGIIILSIIATFFAGVKLASKLMPGDNKLSAVKDNNSAGHRSKTGDDIIKEKKEAVKSNQSRLKVTAQNVTEHEPEPESSRSGAFKGVPVLMYHSISYEKNNDLRVPKELFDEEMKYIKDNGYRALTLDELYMYISNNQPAPPKSVVITLDDGYEDNYTNAYPILKKYGLNATVFVITDTVDRSSSYMTSAQLKELQNNGIDIESHTVGHDDLSKLSYDGQMKTLSGSKDFLEKLLGKSVKYLAFPSGKSNSYTEKACKDSGYAMTFTTLPGKARPEQGIYKLHRVRVSSETNINGFKYLIS